MPRGSRCAAWSAAVAASLWVACQGSGAQKDVAPEPRAAVAAPSPEVSPPAAAAEPAREVRPQAQVRPPAAPPGLDAAARSDSEIGLSWEPSAAGELPVAGYEVTRGDAPAAKVAETKATDRGLRHGTRYCYAVRAFDSAGHFSPRSAQACAETLDTTPPGVPPQLAAAPRPGNQAAITWGAASDDVGVMAYEVYRGEERLTLVTGLAFTAVGLPPLKEQCFTVRALDRAGNRSSPAGPACVTIPDTTPPTVPTQVAARAAGEQEVVVTWGASTDDVGVARYEAVRTDAGGQAGVPVAAEGTSARDHGLAAAHRYCYAVRACDGSGNCSAAAPPACATTPDLTPPSVPGPASASALSDKEVELRWTAATDNVGVTGYEVHRGSRLEVHGAGEVSAREPGLRPGMEYCYTVVALDAAGNRSPATPPACARTPDLTPPTVPERPAAVSVSSSQIFVAWDPSSDDVGVAGYEVLRGATVVAKVATTRARELRLPANTEHCYAVRAFDAAGNKSALSAPACATTADPSQLESPSDLRVVRVSPTSMLLQWEPSAHRGVLYRVYAQGNRSVGLTGANTFTPSGKLGAEPNCFRVVAVDEEGRESPRSNEICAKGTASSPLSAN